MDKSAFSIGKNMDHPHLKGRFTLRIWIPVEQIPLLMGKGREVAQGIKRKTHVKSIDCPVPEPGELWAPVVIVGDPTSSFKAYQAVAKIVEEVDTTAIAEFPLHIRRHAIVVGARGSTLKRISAENTVRIFVPDARHGKGAGDATAGTGDGTEPDKNNIQLEGDIKPIFSALAMIIEAVYGFRAATLFGPFLPHGAGYPSSNYSNNNNDTNGPGPAAPASTPQLPPSSALPSRPPLESGETKSPKALPAHESEASGGGDGGGAPSPSASCSSPRASPPPPPPAAQLPSSASKSTPTTAPSARGIPSGGTKRSSTQQQLQKQMPQPLVKPRSSSLAAAGGPKAQQQGRASPAGDATDKTAAEAAARPRGQPSSNQQQRPRPTPSERGENKPRSQESTVTTAAVSAPEIVTDGWGGSGEYTPTLSVIARDLDSATTAPRTPPVQKNHGRDEAAPVVGDGWGGKPADRNASSERDQSRPGRPPAQAKPQTWNPPPSLPRQGKVQGQGYGQKMMVVPIPGPLPSAEQSEETLRLPTTVISVLQGHHGKNRAPPPATLKDAVKWSILKDIQKHTGTKATAISIPASHEKASSAGHSNKKEADNEASSGTLEKGGGGPPSEGEQGLLVLSIKGPANCVEVAAEALRRLGRGDAVRDALNLVKKTSPHRRLTHQRRCQEQERHRPNADAASSDKGVDVDGKGVGPTPKARSTSGSVAATSSSSSSGGGSRPGQEASAQGGAGEEGFSWGKKTLGGISGGGGGDGVKRGTDSEAGVKNSAPSRNGKGKEKVASSWGDEGARQPRAEDARGGRGKQPGGRGRVGGEREAGKGRGGGQEKPPSEVEPKAQGREPLQRTRAPSQASDEKGESKQSPAAAKRPTTSRPPRNRRPGVSRGPKAGSSGRAGRGRGEDGGRGNNGAERVWTGGGGRGGSGSA